MEAEVKTPRQNELPPQEHFRVLLVDDSKFDREFVEDVFALQYRDRCEVISRADLGAAIHLLESQPERRIDAVLLDLGLGETVGTESYRVFRDHFPDLPVIAFTGDEDPALAAELRRLGAADVLHKSKWTAADIYSSIANAVISGRYSETAERVECIKLPATLLREGRAVQERLQHRISERPPADPESLRDQAHRVSLELLADVSRQLGALEAGQRELRHDLDELDLGHRDTRSDLVDLKVDKALNVGATMRARLQFYGKIVGAIAALAAAYMTGMKGKQLAEMFTGIFGAP